MRSTAAFLIRANGWSRVLIRPTRSQNRPRVQRFVRSAWGSTDARLDREDRFQTGEAAMATGRRNGILELVEALNEGDSNIKARGTIVCRADAKQLVGNHPQDLEYAGRGTTRRISNGVAKGSPDHPAWREIQNGRRPHRRSCRGSRRGKI